MSDDVRQPRWPTDKLTALRHGRRLVTEVPGAGPGRRAFVDIRPGTTAADADAQRQGWKPLRPRSQLHAGALGQHGADRIDGFDHDIGAVLVKATTVTGEDQLTAVINAWTLRPEQFLQPWQTDDPK